MYIYIYIYSGHSVWPHYRVMKNFVVMTIRINSHSKQEKNKERKGVERINWNEREIEI